MRPVDRLTEVRAFEPRPRRRPTVLRRPAPLPRWVVAGVVAVVSTACAAGIALTLLGPEPSAGERVLEYYDDLDFRRYEAAWAQLDPHNRPELDRYLLILSVNDGLVEGYAKLEQLTIDGVEILGDIGRVDVTLHYLTSLETYRVSRSHDVVRRDGRWFLVADPVVESLPANQFLRQQTVDYLDLGRRDQTRVEVDYNEILDRPNVSILDSRLVRTAAQWHIVGQVTNIDVDPADITVAGWLEGPDGERLAAYDGGLATVHKVRPGETVPFRIDFEGIAGAEDNADPSAGDFDPESFTQLQLDRPIAGYAVSAKALVTGRDLDRLALSELRWDDDELAGTVHNPLVVSATIPMLSVARLDSSGEVAWVDGVVLPDGIRPQRSTTFSTSLTPLAEISTVEVPGRHLDTAGGRPAFAAAPTFESDGSALRIVTRTFIREFRP
ncbi:MAG: hypothetical protein HKN26_09455 [Acidimicrobiales bacterium]|nr:hypothetical protein [Acidimicrobiales bacterium]